MKSRKHLLIFISIVLLFGIAIFIGFNRALENKDNLVSTYIKKHEESEVADKKKIEMKPNSEKVVEGDSNKNTVETSIYNKEETSQSKVDSSEVKANNNDKVFREKAVAAMEKEENEVATPEEKKETTTSSGLSFSSREEAIQYGLSRFTAEEIAIYEKAKKKGLTPEQEAMAIKIAYSRFSQAEINALEKALR